MQLPRDGLLAVHADVSEWRHSERRSHRGAVWSTVDSAFSGADVVPIVFTQWVAFCVSERRAERFSHVCASISPEWLSVWGADAVALGFAEWSAVALPQPVSDGFPELLSQRLPESGSNWRAVGWSKRAAICFAVSETVGVPNRSAERCSEWGTFAAAQWPSEWGAFVRSQLESFGPTQRTSESCAVEPPQCISLGRTVALADGWAECVAEWRAQSCPQWSSIGRAIVRTKRPTQCLSDG